jgi:putative transposase
LILFFENFILGLSCSRNDAVQTLQCSLFKHQLFEHKDKLVIRTDNGLPFISHAFEAACERFQIEHERIPPWTLKNAHIEVFHRLLKEKCLGRMLFDSYEEAYQAVMDYCGFIMNGGFTRLFSIFCRMNFTKERKRKRS